MPAQSIRSAESESSSVPASVERVVETVLPTRHGTFRMVGYRDGGGTEHVVLAQGIDDDAHGPQDPPPLVRVHSECLTGDAFGSWRCDCGEQLDAALAAIAQEGRGAVVYVRGHEGRGIGLLAKLKAYALQDQGIDTVDANTALGLPVDDRRYDQAAEILQDLGISAVRLLSGNPAKEEALEELGISVVERRGLAVSERSENAAYLATKRARMRHDDAAPSADAWEALLDGVVPTAPAPGEAEELTHRYGYLAAATGQLVIGQLRQSLDGFIASRSGDSGLHEDRGDHGHLQRLRALVDAVVVGASTVLAEDCSLAVGDVAGRSPVRVVLDAAAKVGADARVFADDGVPTLWITGLDAMVPDALPASVEVVRLPAEEFAPRRVLDILQARGLWKVLVEGGGNTVSRFLEAGLLDRFYLTTAPVLVGDGVPGIRFTGSDVLAEARTAPVRRFVFGRDICTEFNFAAAR
jgi:GTP cyclohydrolase II